MDAAVNKEFQSLFNGGLKKFPENIKDMMPKNKHIIPKNMRYLSQDWIYNSCNCITETKSNIISGVRSAAKKLTEGSKERKKLECFADDLEKIDHLKPESYKGDLEDLEKKYK